VLKEGYDKTFLKRHFRDYKGNLYDGEDGHDISARLEKQRGNGPDDWSDLHALVQVLQQPAHRYESLQKILDMDRFLSFLAMEVITWHWDGYGMKGNNYRLYNNPSDGFVFIPHGMDQMFWDPTGAILPPMAGLAAAGVLETETGKRRYLERLRRLVHEQFQPKRILEKIDFWQKRLQKLLQEIDPQEAKNQARHTENLKASIQERAAFLLKEISSIPSNGFHPHPRVSSPH